MKLSMCRFGAAKGSQGTIKQIDEDVVLFSTNVSAQALLFEVPVHMRTVLGLILFRL